MYKEFILIFCASSLISLHAMEYDKTPEVIKLLEQSAQLRAKGQENKALKKDKKAAQKGSPTGQLYIALNKKELAIKKRNLVQTLATYQTLIDILLGADQIPTEHQRVSRILLTLTELENCNRELAVRAQKRMKAEKEQAIKIPADQTDRIGSPTFEKHQKRAKKYQKQINQFTNEANENNKLRRAIQAKIDASKMVSEKDRAILASM